MGGEESLASRRGSTYVLPHAGETSVDTALSDRRGGEARLETAIAEIIRPQGVGIVSGRP
jgi:hypothetical protein